MPRLRSLAPVLALLAAAPLPSVGAEEAQEKQQIYACKNADGEIVYEAEPCIDPPPKKRTVKKEAPAPVAPAPETPKSAAPAQPAPAPRAAKRAPAAADPALDPVTRAILEEPLPASYDPAVLWLKTHRVTPVVPARGVAPQFATPEKTWETFVGAMRAGDREGARACLTSGALEEFGPRVDGLSPEELRATVDRYAKIEVEGDTGPYWSFRAVRPDARPKWIFFEKIASGAWKIAAI